MKGSMIGTINGLFNLQFISLWVKIPYTLFVLVFVPVYWFQYGPANFLWFSDIALFGTLAALWLESRFLASMMTSGVLLFDIVWNLIFFRKLLLGAGPEGLVGYMFDSQISVWVRALSLFHVALPIIQLWSLGMLGYDARAWKYQVVLGWILLPLTYAVTGPKENINWVFGVTEVPQKWFPASVYLAVLMVIYPALVCFPTHIVLKRLFVK
jgi:hypothetical protein